MEFNPYLLRNIFRFINLTKYNDILNYTLVSKSWNQAAGNGFYIDFNRSCVKHIYINYKSNHVGFYIHHNISKKHDITIEDRWIEVYKYYEYQNYLDESIDYKKLIKHISIHNCYRILELFMDNNKYYFHTNALEINRLLQLSVSYQNPNILELLLRDPRAYPSASNNYLLCVAIHSRISKIHTAETRNKIIIMLLKDSRMHLSDSILRNTILQLLCCHDEFKIFELLIDINPNIYSIIMEEYDHLVQIAKSYGNKRIVKYLIQLKT